MSDVVNLLDSKILIVDDEPINVDLIEQTLIREGFCDFRSVYDSRKVVDIYREFKPDLVLLDLNMPYMDGFQVMSQLQEIEKASYLPILVLTAQVDKVTRVRALNEGAKDFLTKPLDLVEVMCRIRNMLEVRHLHNQIRDQNKTLEEKVRERTADLQQTTEVLQDFLYMASHDMQEPLRKISLFGDLLEKKYSDKLGDDGRGYLQRLQVGNHRIQRLVQDLVKFTNIAFDALTIKPIDLQKLVSKIASDLNASDQITSGKIEVCGLPTLEADKRQMIFLFDHLISNALKFCRKDEPPWVKITNQPTGNGSFEIRIADNGIGIEKRYLDKIFKPTQRLQGRRKLDGSGMGLSLSRKIVERHCGKITARSEVQVGTTFIITLPGKPAS